MDRNEVEDTLSDLAEYALSTSRKYGILYSSISVRNSVSLYMHFRDGNLNLISPSTDSGLSVRIVTNEGVASCSTNRLNRKDVKEAVRLAHSMAKAAEGRHFLPQDEKGERRTWRTPVQKSFGSVAPEEKIRSMKELDEMLISKRMKSRREAGYVEEDVFKRYLDSNGTEITGVDSKVNIYYHAIQFNGADSEQVYRNMGYSGGLECFERLKLPDLADEDRRNLELMLEKGRTFHGGKMDVICGEEVTGIACHESCGHPMEADRILGREGSQAGKSFVRSDMKGEVVGSELVTIVDDPTLEGSFGYYEYDDEGIRARRRVLYREGRINEFLQNRESGYRTGEGSNGAGRSSSYGSEPLVRMANTFLLPGEFSHDELLEGVKEGLFIRGFNEWNIDDRRFNQKYVGRDAFLIRNGEMGEPVRAPVLEITTPGFWKSVDAVGRELKFYGGNCGKGDPMQGMEVDMGGPEIRLRGIRVK